MRHKICIFAILLILNLSQYETKPTFGDEFVHIKVHLPKEAGEAHTHHGPPVHAHPAGPPPHKVVHHFHHKRRRPAKKNAAFGKHTGLLESIILSEVKKPISSDHYKYLNHAEDIAQHVDAIITKPEKPKPHVETYKLIEEKIPKQTVETFKVIESKVPQKHQQHHGGFYHEQDSLEHGYHYKPPQHGETFKVIESILDDYHTQVEEPHYQYLPPKKQRVKTVKIIDSHEQEPTGHGHYDYGSQEYGAHDDSYHYASKPHAESVKIVETKAPDQHLQEYSINFDKRPHSETVKIIKTNKPSKTSSYYNRHQHHQHFDGGQKNQGYQYQRPGIGGNSAPSYDDSFAVGYDYKTQDSYRTIPDEHYTQEPVQYAPEDTYLPPKRPSSDHHHYNHQHSHHHNHHSHYSHHSNEHKNSLYDDEPVAGIGAAVTSPNDSYLPPTLLELDGSNAGDSTSWSQPDGGYKATETYAGIDSYSAGHVQGVGSGGYQYPSPYP